ncbi:hypothetical protein PMAYCL1PPCAC_11356, partial [Pristionchus mayeri]
QSSPHADGLRQCTAVPMAATTRRRRFAFVALATALAALTLAHQVATVSGAPDADRRAVVFEDEDHYFGCLPDRCEDPLHDSFFSFYACCGYDCCHKFRFWVIPAGIASVGFVAGAFFALCFQCRD